ncbi:MAG TPA: hypothetical protein VF918_02320 [Anaerolineales bacterium]
MSNLSLQIHSKRLITHVMREASGKNPPDRGDHAQVRRIEKELKPSYRSASIALASTPFVSY